MYCRFCGTRLSEDALFCHACGKKMVVESVITKRAKALMGPFIKAYQKVWDKCHEMKIKRLLVIGAWVGLVVATGLVVKYSLLPAYKTIKISKAKALINEEAYEEAIAAFTSAAALDSSNPELYKDMGKAYFSIEDYENAGAVLTKALGFDELRDIELYTLMAEVYYYEEDYLNYEDTLWTLIRLYPNNGDAYIKLGAYYADMGSYDRAQQVLEELLLREENGEATKLLYNIYLESYNHNQASQKAKALRDKAYRYLSGEVRREFLEVQGQSVVSVSGDGNYLVTALTERNKKYLCVYGREKDTFVFLSRFNIPLTYMIEGAAIAWSPDNKTLAFCNANGKPYANDSYIYTYNIETEALVNISDPRSGYVNYTNFEGYFIIDTLPVFSEDGKRLYFARHASGGNGLYQADLETDEVVKLYEPMEGAQVAYNIVERKGVLYFSVMGQELSGVSGIYKYEDGQGELLRFDYDDRYYYLALGDISADGRYLLYSFTMASQNNSYYFGIVDLDTMKGVTVYDQAIDYLNNRFTSLNTMDFFGENQLFICKNAVFSLDGKSLLIAEEGVDFSGKTLRKVNLQSGNSQYLYMSFEKQNAEAFSLHYQAGGNAHSVLKELENGGYLVYDQALQILYAQ